MAGVKKERKIAWYRCPVEREVMASLNQRSDLKGLAQALGHLGLLVLSGAAFWLSAGRLPLWVSLLILFVHGTLYAFLLNAFHELCHKSVFKSKILNTLFLDLVSFLSWYNPVFFWTSHQEHHKYTLHPPDDLEVVLPIHMTLNTFLMNALVNPWDLYTRLKTYLRFSFGRLEGEWENALFPESAPALRRSLFNWARFQLIGQGVLVGVSLLLGLWQIPVLVCLAPFYGGWLHFLCNSTQHVGLMDNVADFRLCCRTILLNPVVQFLYWHMNYHTEHHMFAAVPCYNLARLHRQIKPEMPHCPVGLVETWQVVIAILKKQAVDPTYQFVAELPTPSKS